MNYRPICLTSVLGKLMERLIRNAIINQKTANNLFSESQHRFLKGKSSVTQLLEYLEDITEALGNGINVADIYLDFCKAFNKIQHQRLLKTLENME